MSARSGAFVGEELADLRSEARALIRAQELRYWQNRVTGAPLEVAETYRGHERLFSRDTLAAVEAAVLREPDARERRALRYFRNYLAAEHVGKETAPIVDRLQTLSSSETVSVDGRVEPYRNLSTLLVNEPSRERRRVLAEAAAPVLRKLNPLHEQREHATLALVRALGYPGYVAFAEELRLADLRALRATAERFLDESEDPYLGGMRAAVPRVLGFPFAEMRRSDSGRFANADRFRPYFAADRMLPVLARTLSGMGIELAAQPNILVHAEPLPRKSPRAACYTIDVPDDVRVTVKPVGGIQDYTSLFHEMGHAQHFAHTRADRFEFQFLGNLTVTETYAFLFESLLEDPFWVATHLAMDDATEAAYLRHAALRKLFIVRRYAAKLCYETEWHAGTLDDPRAAYARWLGRAYGYPLTETDTLSYLDDHDEFFYAADYVRAWFLEAQLARVLVERVDERWFEARAAGDLLRELWSHGQEWTGDELAAHLGVPALDTRALLDRLGALL